MASSSLLKQSQPGPNTRESVERPEACVSVITLWSKVTVEAVDTTPLPNNCQCPAVGLERLSQGPGGASCHNFVQGVGLSFGKLWSCE